MAERMVESLVAYLVGCWVAQKAVRKVCRMAA